MSGGIPFDLILFGAIALFLVLRLGNVLGKRTGHQKRPGDLFPGPNQGNAKKDQDEADDDNVVALPGARDADDPVVDSPMMQGPAGSGLAQIRIADPSFDPDGFVEGAKMAFEMIVQAYAEADSKTLKNLLSKEVFDNFSQAIKDRAAAGNRMEDTLVGIDKADILEARIVNREAHITIKFVSKQVNVTYDGNNEVVEGDPATVLTVTDIWTFARDTKSRDPNWTLIATRTPN